MSRHSTLTGTDLHISKVEVGVANPNGAITAGVIGQIHWDSVNNRLYIAEAADNSSWIHSGSELDSFVEMSDTPVSISSDLVLQGNSGGNALEFGQNLKATGSPTFADLVLTGDLTVQGLTTTLDVQTLLVEDKNIELGNVATPTDVTADGGGIILKASPDITILWRNASNEWEFNQSLNLIGNNLRTTGTLSAGQSFIGSLKLIGNTLSSTNPNGDILLAPNGTGKVGIGTLVPDASALLELKSTTKGFLPPRMTTVEKDAIASPVTGLSLFDLTLDKPVVRTSSEFKTLLTEDLGQVIVQETFASTNVRFFGELALPAAQGWTDTATGSATIDLETQTVFGELKQVVRHNDNVGNGSTTSKITITTQNWLDINAFGASYGGTARLDTVTGLSGFFSGLQANSAENPLATGNRRYGLTFSDSAGNLRVASAGGAAVVMDGTGGNPAVLFDEWFLWECVVPAGLGAAELYINKILTTLAPAFNVNTGGLGTQILLSSGSTAGTGRVTYHDNFGVTIFEESSTKTLVAATMAGDVAQINIPEGKRDYTIILPDGNPRAIGAVLRLVANNVLGLISLENQNPAAPEILYNGLRTSVLKIAIKEVMDGINTVNSGNVYIGFKAEDVDRSNSIFAQLHSIIDQIPTDVNPTVITYTNHDAINGIGHSTTINTGELEILPGLGGTYFIMAQPQVGKDSGGLKVDFDMFLQVDRGSGFVDVANSNIKLTIKDSDITDVIVSAITIQLQVGDKVRMMQVVSNAAVGMGLKNTDPVVGPPSVPRTPSIIFTMSRVGG